MIIIIIIGLCHTSNFEQKVLTEKLLTSFSLRTSPFNSLYKADLTSSVCPGPRSRLRVVLLLNDLISQMDCKIQSSRLTSNLCI